MVQEPSSEIIRDWKHRIENWDLAASEEHRQVTESVLLLNGKPTGFQDVKEGPAVYVGRENAHYGLERSPLANPYPVSEYPRKDSLLKYTDTLIEAVQEDEQMQDAVLNLYGKPVACWCLPKLCHGHVLSLYLVYRLHAGMDPKVAGEQITRTIQNRIDSLIEKGEANPADYY
jgi:hypothetical protein